MNKPLEIRGSLLARNTLLNFIGQGVPLLVAVVTIPFVVRGLGTERYGLLSLAWMILGYFTIFDLGFGRATTKFVAEALGRGEPDEVPRLVWTAVATQGLLGLLGALILVGITPLLVERILSIPPELIGEAKATLYMLALSIPVVLISGSFGGVLGAAQRFDLANAVGIPLSVSTYLLPLIGLLLGFHLPGIVALILASRFMALLAFIALDLRIYPQLGKLRINFASFPRLFSYGGWITVSSIVGNVLLYLDRILIASLLSMAALAYYAVPQGVIERLWIVPASFTATLFPAFSALEGGGNRQRLETFFARSIKYILLALGPVVLTLWLFAKEILHLWLGSDFALHSTVVLQVLALSALVNCLAHVPYTLLQGVGRPDFIAKFHLLELPLRIAITWVLVIHWGIAGAAAAWAIFVTLDALLLFVAAFKICRLSPHLLASNGLMLAGLALMLLTGMAYGLRNLAGALPLFAQSLLFVALFGLFAWAVWKMVIDTSDRGVVLHLMKLWQSSENIS